MPKPQPQKYRTTNWRDYNQSLKQRGSMLLWIDTKWTGWQRETWSSQKCSDAALQFCLMVKNLFGLALRLHLFDGGNARFAVRNYEILSLNCGIKH
ncbi:transposase [Methylomonas koyamae]|uniref:transposase n=1 Tax=Methylomonas koyamae TaxID=702114 RepID=UPI0009EF3C38